MGQNGWLYFDPQSHRIIKPSFSLYQHNTNEAQHQHSKATKQQLHNSKLQQQNNSARVLDVGSGSGYLSACFAEMVGETGHVLGIEIIPELVEWSISNIKKQNPEYLSKGDTNLLSLLLLTAN